MQQNQHEVTRGEKAGKANGQKFELKRCRVKWGQTDQAAIKSKNDGGQLVKYED